MLLLAGGGSFLGRLLSVRAAGEKFTVPVWTLVISLAFFAATMWTLRQTRWAPRTRGLVVAALIATYVLQSILRARL